MKNSVFMRARRLPMRSKLLLVTLLSSVAGLLLAGTAVVLYEGNLMRRGLVEDTTVLARLIADRSTAALTFQDAGLAAENLEALRVKPEIAAACILDGDGRVFARYGRFDRERLAALRPGAAGQARFLGGRLLLTEPIELSGKRIGSVYVEADLAGFRRRQRVFMTWVFAIIAVAAALALYLSARLQRSVTGPLLGLAATARAVAGGGNYSLRAKPAPDDEIGLLVRAFNSMLEVIERQHEENRRINASLEERVATRTSELEAANRELEAFSYSVSHDLRAPLRHASGYVDLLVKRCRGDLSEKGLHYLDAIADSVRQMGMLIDDLLQFSRTGRAELRLKPADMNRILADALAAVRDQHADRAIAWSVGVLPAVRCDEAMLRLVWTNLLGNAAKFTRTRENAAVEIGAAPGAGETVFFVRDNGVGFDMRYAAKLFGVFQRLHASSEFEGTGIGLANVRRIVSRHGGRTWAEAEPDKGATFFFTLPATKEANE
jgi:signal transduction histidine kinase